MLAERERVSASELWRCVRGGDRAVPASAWYHRPACNGGGCQLPICCMCNIAGRPRRRVARFAGLYIRGAEGERVRRP